MKAIVLLLASAILLAANAGATETQTFVGTITDTMCGAKHVMAQGQPDDQCTKVCVRDTSSQYALFDGKQVLRLSDQKTPARFAAKKVKVTGTYNEKTKTIKVASIEAAN
jgi:hypothetical protein